MKIISFSLMAFLLFAPFMSGGNSDCPSPLSTGAGEEFTNNILDESVWLKRTKGVDYIEKEEKKKKEKEKKKKKESDSSSIDWKWLNSVLKGLLFIIGIGALSFLIYQIIIRTQFLQNKKVEKREVTLEYLEQNLPMAEIKSHLQLALENGDYRLALRLQYLSIIKALSENELIEWDEHKTNGDYLRELRSTDFFKSFRAITNSFEVFWYGDEVVSKNQYEQLAPKYDGFLNNLEQNPS